MARTPSQPAPWVRALVATLALIFLLVAADPTPRFLGLPRVPQLTGRVDQPVVPTRANPVLEKYDLPWTLCAKSSSTPLDDIALARPAAWDRGATHEVDATPPHAALLSTSLPAEVGPPLRC